ncbi:MAG: hypothetical protein ACRENP_22705 [Longimicrobiales bacterium]
MMQFACAWSVLALGLFATHVAAQEKPNFSGRWTIQAEPTAARSGEGRANAAGGGAGARGGGRGPSAGDMGSGWGSTITITQDGSRLVVEYAFFGRGDMQPALKFVYALDGSETKNTVMMGRGIQAETSRASWIGEKLVITTLHSFPNPANGQPMTSEVVRTLSLESATALVVEVVRNGVLGGPSSSTRTIYTKTE